MLIAHLFSSILVLSWCAAIFVAFVGWGHLVGKTMGIPRTGIGISAALGVVSQCVIGGILNYFHLIYPSVLIIQVVAGILFFVDWLRIVQPAQFLQSYRAMSGRYKLAALAVLIVIGLHLFSFLEPRIWNPWDDLECYLFLPKKMMQLHHLMPDPYSQRRVISSVGFNYYLQNLFLLLAPLRNIMLVDGGLGILLLCAASWDLSRIFNLNKNQVLVFVLLAGVTEELYLNITFVWLPCALLLCLAICAASPKESWGSGRARLMAFGGICAAATALKNNYAVFVTLYVLLFLVVTTLFRTDRPKTKAIRFLAGLAIITFCGLGVIAFWMLDLHRYTGTYFFPVLGHGFEYSTYHLLPVRTAALSTHLKKGLLFASPLAVLGMIQLIYIKARDKRVLAVITFTFAASLSITATYLATGGDSVRRYCCPQIVASLLLAFLLFCIPKEKESTQRMASLQLLPTAWACVIILFAVWGVCSLSYGPLRLKPFAKQVTGDFVASIQEKEIEPAGKKQEYFALQNSLPANAVVLENVSYPFLFDNTRQTFYDASLPAMASPPPAPGWPIFSSGEVLGQWLVSHGVQYLAYSYDDEAGWKGEPLEQHIADPTLNSVLYATYVGVYNSHKQYLDLAATRKHIFDDGRMFVLDLNAPR